jgi:hypothetical protein
VVREKIITQQYDAYCAAAEGFSVRCLLCLRAALLLSSLVSIETVLAGFCSEFAFCELAYYGVSILRAVDGCFGSMGRFVGRSVCDGFLTGGRPLLSTICVVSSSLLHVSATLYPVVRL